MKTATLLILSILAVVAIGLALRTARPLHASTLPQQIVKDPDFLQSDHTEFNFRVHSRQHEPNGSLDNCAVLAITIGGAGVIGLIIIVYFMMKKK